MPRLRAFSWVILAVNLVFLIWAVTVISAVSDASKDCGSLTAEECEAAGAVGTAIGLGIVLFLWAVVDGILAVICVVTKPKRRPCPVCGADVKPGLMFCTRCGHDFRTAPDVVPRRLPSARLSLQAMARHISSGSVGSGGHLTAARQRSWWKPPFPDLQMLPSLFRSRNRISAAA